MPTGTKLDGKDWITDAVAVSDFLDRLDLLLESGTTLDLSFIRTLRDNALRYRRFTTAQSLAVKRVEEAVEVNTGTQKETDFFFFGDDVPR